MSPPRAEPWAPIAGGLTRRYGLPTWSFREFGFWTLADGPTVYMAVAGAAHPESREALLNIGWPVLTGPWPDGQPTAELLRIVGADATRNVLEVDDAGAEAFERGEPLAVPATCDADVLILRRGRQALGGVDRRTGQRA